MKTVATLIKRRKIIKYTSALAVAGLMLTSGAQAQMDTTKDAAQKVAIITQMYDQDIQNDGLGESVLNAHASSALKAALQREQDYFDREQMLCGTDFDVLWESQDPDYSQDKTIAMRGDLVAVTLAHGDTVQYQMVCDGKCAVDDVIMSDGESLKDYLNKSCQ